MAAAPGATERERRGDGRAARLSERVTVADAQVVSHLLGPTQSKSGLLHNGSVAKQTCQIMRRTLVTRLPSATTLGKRTVATRMPQFSARCSTRGTMSPCLGRGAWARPFFWIVSSMRRPTRIGPQSRSKWQAAATRAHSSASCAGRSVISVRVATEWSAGSGHFAQLLERRAPGQGAERRPGKALGPAGRRTADLPESNARQG